MSPFTAEDHLFTVIQKGVGVGGWLPFNKVWIFCSRENHFHPRPYCLCFKFNSSSQIGTFQLRQKCEELEREILARSSVEVPTTPDSMSVKSNQSQQWAQSSAV